VTRRPYRSRPGGNVAGIVNVKRAKLAIKPSSSSPAAAMTIGIVAVDCLARKVASTPRVRMQAGTLGNRSVAPLTNAYSMTRFCPSM